MRLGRLRELFLSLFPMWRRRASARDFTMPLPEGWPSASLRPSLSENNMAYTTCTVPAGDKISISNGKLTVPNNPVIPFIRGDGTGPDIWASSVRVFDAAVEKAYSGTKKISWMEVFAGETSKNKFDNWLPDD